MGLFTSNGEFSNCWQYEIVHITPLPAFDLSAITFDSSTMKVKVVSWSLLSAGEYHVALKAVDRANGSTMQSF